MGYLEIILNKFSKDFEEFLAKFVRKFCAIFGKIFNQLWKNFVKFSKFQKILARYSQLSVTEKSVN